MDNANQDINKLTDNNASSNMSVGSRITRNCSRCRNHGLKIAQKGHRKVCEYRDCFCERCKLFSDQRSMKTRHTELRPLTQDEDSTSLSIDGSSFGSGPQSVKNVEGSYDSNSGDSSVSNQGSNEIQDGNGDVAIIASSKEASSSNRSPSATTSWPPGQAGTESNVSWDASSTSNSGTNPRTKPTCTLCRNHNVINILKGHKRYCKYLYCTCSKCCNTHKRRKKMSKQVALKRELIQDEEQIRKFGKLVKPVRPPLNRNHVPTVPQPAWSVEGNYGGAGSGINNLVSNSTPRKVPVVEPHIPPPIHLIQPQPNANVEMLLAHSTNLLQRFQYPWDMLTLMYAIVKYADANLDEAFRRIDEANNDIKSLEIFNMVKKFWSDNMFYFPEYIPMTGITDAPTYEGQAPFIGDPHPQHPEHFRLLPHLQNAHIPTNNSSLEHRVK